MTVAVTGRRSSVRSSAERGSPAHRLAPPHQVLDHILEDRRVELVVNFLPFPFGEDEARGAEHGQMAMVGQLDRNRGAISPEVFGPARSIRRISGRV
jgi:hypothetical protein